MRVANDISFEGQGARPHASHCHTRPGVERVGAPDTTIVRGAQDFQILHPAARWASQAVYGAQMAVSHSSLQQVAVGPLALTPGRPVADADSQREQDSAV
ncbi:MAG: hypothetical protein GTO63_35055 [Anaerolineae bacterium]|nr:hypothetical protein [Anaerolineae bacterium]NIN99913.1 hypothetical protein [Anaerolineae bacterium]NIQ79350.1 hypothetical protein [Anaerolineae bacterium]